VERFMDTAKTNNLWTQLGGKIDGHSQVEIFMDTARSNAL